MKYDPALPLTHNLIDLLDCGNRSNIFDYVSLLLKERDGSRAALSELSYKNEQNVCELDAYRAGNHPDLKPQLTEIRYVLHGDIQPCSVLYSDDTTTLLRLDEGDIMCETDTIEWSDSVTYRCQDLLKGAMGVHGRAVNQRTLRAVAQLVRDERILLNDNGGEVRNALPRPPAPAPEPTCNNPYKHNSTLCEQDLRNAGWTTEGLVQNGYGHYIPVQHPADTER